MYVAPLPPVFLSETLSCRWIPKFFIDTNESAISGFGDGFYIQMTQMWTWIGFWSVGDRSDVLVNKERMNKGISGREIILGGLSIASCLRHRLLKPLLTLSSSFYTKTICSCHCQSNTISVRPLWYVRREYMEPSQSGMSEIVQSVADFSFTILVAPLQVWISDNSFLGL